MKIKNKKPITPNPKKEEDKSPEDYLDRYETTPAFSDIFVDLDSDYQDLMDDMGKFSRRMKFDSMFPPSEKKIRRRRAWADEDRQLDKMDAIAKEMEIATGKISTKRPMGMNADGSKNYREADLVPDYLDPNLNPNIKTLGDQYRLYDQMRKGESKGAKVFGKISLKGKE